MEYTCIHWPLQTLLHTQWLAKCTLLLHYYKKIGIQSLWAMFNFKNLKKWIVLWRAPKSLVRPKLGPSYSIAEMWGTRGTLPAFNTKRGRRACWSSGIGTRKSDKPYLLSYSILHQNQPTSWLIHIRNTFGVGTSHGQPWTHLTHHGLDSREATTFPLIVFSALLHRTYIQMALFPETPKVESRNCPGLDCRDFGRS
jgi:hypothetical protein